MKNYHTFANYYRLYSNLCRELKEEPIPKAALMPTALLHVINRLLIRLNCVELTEIELGRTLK